MRILALETSARAATVALLADDKTLRRASLPETTRTAQSLAPALRGMLQEEGWKPNDIDLVALTIGPGSFTGLRVGVTTAKTFAYAADAEVMALNTLDVAAAQTPEPFSQFVVLLDAMRGQYFRKTFRRAGDALETLRETEIVELEDLQTEVDPQTAITGPAADKFLAEHHGEPACVPEAFRIPHAETVGRLAWQEYQAGRRDDLWTLVPKYYRKSAAEEKLESPPS